MQRLSQETLKANDIAEDYAKRQATASARIAKAWNEVKVGIAEALTPERIEAFTAAITGTLKIAGQLVASVSQLAGGIRDILKLDFSTTTKQKQSVAKKFGDRFSDEELAALPGAFGRDIRHRLAVRRQARGGALLKLTEDLVGKQPFVPGFDLQATRGASAAIDQPFRYTGGGSGGGSISVSPVVNVHVDRAGAGPEEIAAELDKGMRRATETMARDIAAVAGQ
jgi:hypothetical protein